MMKRDHPVQALQLVTAHLSIDDCKGLAQGKMDGSKNLQLGEASNTKGWSSEPMASPSFNNSSSSSFSDLRCRVVLSLKLKMKRGNQNKE
jgi:hypothetical protein